MGDICVSKIADIADKFHGRKDMSLHTAFTPSHRYIMASPDIDQSRAVDTGVPRNFDGGRGNKHKSPKIFTVKFFFKT